MQGNETLKPRTSPELIAEKVKRFDIALEKANQGLHRLFYESAEALLCRHYRLIG